MHLKLFQIWATHIVYKHCLITIKIQRSGVCVCRRENVYVNHVTKSHQHSWRSDIPERVFMRSYMACV